jgi:hypothetical protein
VFNGISFVQLATTSADQLEAPPFYIRDTRILVASLVLLVFFLNKIKKGGLQTKPPSNP